MAIYDRATKAVAEAEKEDMYRLYIRKVEANFGVTRTRAVYERAIKELNDTSSKTLCIEFADMEMKVGEIDRARAIYTYGSQVNDVESRK